MSKETPKEKRLYAMFLAGNPPQQFVSNQDLVASYLEQLRARKRANDWNEPFTIVDDETGAVVACYSWGSILGIVQGAPVTEEGGTS